MSKTPQHIYDIDFVKGIAIISVIFLHTLPRSILERTLAVFHIWQAVPIFIFISFFLGFRNLGQKDNVLHGYYSRERIKKLFYRIWVPLMIFAVFETAFFVCRGNFDKAIGCLLCFDNGPGSYYVWCYMQLWLSMPFIYLLIKRKGIYVGGGILLVLSVLLDFLWERYIGIKPGFNCFRYLFLGVPAFMYLKGFNMKKVMPLVLFSMIYLAIMLYSEAPLFAEPILPDGWEIQTSMGFFYTLFLYVLLTKLYVTAPFKKIENYIAHIGTISWEIFIVQMVLIGSGILNYLSNILIEIGYLQVGFKIVLTLIISILFAEFYNKKVFALHCARNK